MCEEKGRNKATVVTWLSYYASYPQIFFPDLVIVVQTGDEEKFDAWSGIGAVVLEGQPRRTTRAIAVACGLSEIGNKLSSNVMRIIRLTLHDQIETFLDALFLIHSTLRDDVARVPHLLQNVGTAV